jgi:peptide/nickel transport system permease protein
MAAHGTPASLVTVSSGLRSASGASPLPRRSLWWRLGGGSVVGFGVGLVVLAVVLGWPRWFGVDPERVDLAHRLAPPVLFGGTLAHPLGTDQLGRDLLVRTLVGARVSLLVGIVGTLLSGLAGVTLGVVAGYVGGWPDRVVRWLADVQLALPFVVVAIGVVAALGNSLGNVLLVLALTGWVGYARIVRLQALSLRQAPFVEAARVAGAGIPRILGRHMLPNLAGPIVVIASQQVAAMILYESALSYLGLGVPTSVVTWGRMVADGRDTLLTAWWVATVPGAAIALTVLVLNLTGDRLGDRLDPATRRRARGGNARRETA